MEIPAWLSLPAAFPRDDGLTYSHWALYTNQWFAVKNLLHLNGCVFGQGFFGKAHPAGKLKQEGYCFRRFLCVHRDFHIKTICKAFCVTAENRSLFVKMGRDPDALISYGHLLFCRNLRHVGDQSERHPGNEVS